jgi:ATP-dependent protease HslVU (ClpYQ) peptidase subunit
MTCIAAAVEENGTVWMGGDSGLNSGECSLQTALPKVFCNGDFLIGVSGTSRLSQIIRNVFVPPEVKQSPEAYFVKDFVAVLRECLREHGGECKNEEDEGPETVMDGRVLVGYKDWLVSIDGSYGVCVLATPFQAIGSGAMEARAAMLTAWKLLPKPISGERVVKLALEAAAEFDGNIRPPFTIQSLPQVG